MAWFRSGRIIRWFGRYLGVYRVERDYLGEVEVPWDAYWGAWTQRGLRLYKAAPAYPEVFIKSYVMVKMAAALANMELGVLDRERGEAIVKACGEILGGKLLDQFPTSQINSGAGTIMNMNVNEVIANRALEIMGRRRGEYSVIHPNDHVNMSQSTNDTFPTALRVACLLMWRRVKPLFMDAATTFQDLSKNYRDVVRIGKTHYRNAVPTTFGRLFRSYAEIIRRGLEHIDEAAERLEEVPLGGTAVGAGTNAPRGFREKAVKNLSEISGLRLRAMEPPEIGLQSLGDYERFSNAISTLASDLIKINNDIMFMSFIGELELKPLHGGSSIMPGKINPSIFEHANMVLIQVQGYSSAIRMASPLGHMDLNVYMPLIARCLMESLIMLEKMLPPYIGDGLGGLRPGKPGSVFRNPATATLLSGRFGYDKAAEIYSLVESGLDIRDAASRILGISREEVENIIREELGKLTPR